MHHKPFKLGAGLTILTACISGALLGAPSAAAAPIEETVTCDGQQLVIQTPGNNSSDMGGWSAARIVEGGSGTLIPTSFSGTAFDETIGQTIFEFTAAKGNGQANQNQPTLTCTQTFTATLADLLDPGEELPPGTSPTDEVTFTLTAIVVHVP